MTPTLAVDGTPEPKPFYDLNTQSWYQPVWDSVKNGYTYLMLAAAALPIKWPDLVIPEAWRYLGRFDIPQLANAQLADPQLANALAVGLGANLMVRGGRAFNGPRGV
jgi:hypothetical protein